MNEGLTGTERRVLLLAPTPRDSQTAEKLLAQVDIGVCPCASLADLCAELGKGAAVVFLAEETLGRDDAVLLEEAVARQPPWSDIPVLVLTRGVIHSRVAAKALETLGNVTLIERPLRVPTLVSAIRSALRSRARQYQIRQHLEERERTGKALRENEARLRLIMENVRDHAIYTLDVDGNISDWNTGAERVFGYTPEEILGKPGGIVFTGEDRAAREPEKELLRCIRQGHASGGRWHVRKTGSRFWAEGSMERLQDREGRPKGFVRIVSDKTERKKNEERLRENDRRKDEFLAMLAHELRNPLSAISNGIQIVKRPDAGPHRDWATGVIEAHVVHLSRMIDDLLDVSRITRGKITLKKQELDLTRAIHSAAESARPFIEERRHRFLLTLEPGPIAATGDPTRLEQIFVNLLNNAAKFTEPDGKISLTSTLADGHLEVEVRDNGIGMAPDLLENAFELFVQGDRGIARSEGGLGIGLTLVRSLVKLHGGTVRAESAGTGHGTCFTVTLPVKPAPPKATARPALDENGIPPRSILVVDDNVDAAECLAQLLELSGHDTEVAHDGPAALEAARNHRPDVILLDIGLPEMDGFEVARTLRREGFRETLIIAVSGYGEEARSKSSGFDHHLVKPVDFTELNGWIARAPQPDRHALNGRS